MRSDCCAGEGWFVLTHLHDTLIRLIDELAEDVLNICQSCPHFPVIGNQHGAGSRYCQIHLHLGEPLQQQVVSDSDKMSLSYICGSAPTDMAQYGTLPRHDDANGLNYSGGCKKFSAVNRFYSTTAGFLVVARPCGIIVNFTEMFTAESCTQVAVLLHQTFKSDFNKLKFVGYDRSCDLHPMLLRLARTQQWAKQLLDHTRYFVDRWHCNKHTEPKCDKESAQCLYHPAVIEELDGVNGEICEQTFRWWNRFRGTISNMNMVRCQFFTMFLITYRNKFLEQRS